MYHGKRRHLNREKQSALAVMKVIDLAYSDLVSGVGGGNGDNFFGGQRPGCCHW